MAYTPYIHLQQSGVSVVVALGITPALVYWGSALDDDAPLLEALVTTSLPATLNSSMDEPRRFPLIPTQADGWSGTPGLSWHSGPNTSLALRATGHTSTASSVTVTYDDSTGLISASETLQLHPGGALSGSINVTNSGTKDVTLDSALVLLPLPSRANEILDFTGRWSEERAPQRRAVSDGSWIRATHRGRAGHDAPFLTAVGTPSFSYNSGELWASHTAWSGSVEHIVERLPEGAGTFSTVLGGGEVLEPGEITLTPGSSYSSPAVFFSYSDTGLDTMSHRFHAYVRSLAAYPAPPRPLLINTWEAVYFDQNLPKLKKLADTAASVGVERFVLDDGWFTGRRDDTKALGDWTVDKKVWPEGLEPLSSHVHNVGMEFGLWVEPEMINPDSELARQHPDWILNQFGSDGPTWRHQLVLNLANSEAWEHIFTAISSVVEAVKVDFLKWDHNRDLHVALDPDHRAQAHAQTLATYRLMDALRIAHPGLEIESCASGGGRIDLEMAAHVQRFWASDDNDPIERTPIQNNTALLIPPELLGCDVGPDEADVTHRTTSLGFREMCALTGNPGIEWDVTKLGNSQLASLRTWAKLYKEYRPLLNNATVWHSDDSPAGCLLTVFTGQDGHDALVFYTRLTTSSQAHLPRLRVPGLKEQVGDTFKIQEITSLGSSTRHQIDDPQWMNGIGDGVVLPAALLSTVGVPLPQINAGSTVLFNIHR